MENYPENNNVFNEPPVNPGNSDNPNPVSGVNPHFPENNNPYGNNAPAGTAHTQPQPGMNYGAPAYSSEPSPVSIYNNSHTGNGPQYHYGNHHGFLNNQYLEEQRRKLMERRHHERNIKKLGTQNGIALLSLLVVANIFASFLIIPTFYRLYEESIAFASAFGIFYSVVTMGGIFALFAKLKKGSKYFRPVPYNKPADPFKAFLLIVVGFGGCYLANYITSILKIIGDSIGVYSDYSALQEPTGTFDILLIFVGTSIIPPLVEEFAMRGVVMQNLRRYGSAFAIVSSAVFFGVLHGNAAQIPFALLCGLFLGYAVIATESIWTGVIIHLLINGMSAISSALMFYYDTYVANMFYTIGGWIGVIAGIVALVIYTNRYKNEFILKNKGEAKDLPLKTKIGKFISSPAMIIAIILYCIQAITTLSLTPPNS